MIVTQLDVTADDALLRLRAHAYANNLTASDAARLVVSRTLRLEK
jgi:hypothetical protein